MTQARLRIESKQHSAANDYRIHDGQVEVRVLDARHRQPSNWRTMDENDVQLHRALDTVVAKWLSVRLDSESRN